MADMVYVCLYARYLQTLEPYTDAERGRIMTAMLTYATTGKAPTFEGNERFIWPTIQAQIDRDEQAYQDRCEKNRVNGVKGGRPPKNQTVSAETERFSEKPKKANTKTNKNTNRNTNSNMGNGADKPPTRSRFTPPTIDEVRVYCLECNYSGVDPERFVNFYQSKGWKVGKESMKDWKAAVRNWNSRDKGQVVQNGGKPLLGYKEGENWTL